MKHFLSTLAVMQAFLLQTLILYIAINGQVKTLNENVETMNAKQVYDKR